ncbi:hypothetical protein FACS1894140_2940 [Spirochaetia bacterium]|nr:hypothetical protein FACS1894140_2940 [Spirochaetia bacterium]
MEEHIEFAKKLGYSYIYINTNGWLATPERAKTLIDSGLDSIKFSMNAISREDYKAIHGVDGFERVINNIRAAYEYRNKCGKKCNVYAAFVETSKNKDHIAEAVKAMQGIVDEVMTFKVTNRGGQINEVESDLYTGTDALSFKYPCGFPFNTATITAEGYLVLCCQDFCNETVIADLNNTSIVDAWNSEKFVKFRERHLANDLEGTLCYNCLNNMHKPIVPMTEGVHMPKVDLNLEKELNERIRQFNKSVSN